MIILYLLIKILLNIFFIYLLLQKEYTSNEMTNKILGSYIYILIFFFILYNIE